RPMGLTVAKEKVLYTIIPTKIIFKYVQDEAVKAEAAKLIKEGKVCNSYYYEKDRNLKRTLAYLRNQYHYFNKYKRYFNNKGLRD
ncbi:MAG: ATP-grasp domain-containing protein, partial [Oscillospiraceae bacterium]